MRDRQTIVTHTCECGKFSYASRRLAKRVLRRFPHERLNVYRCAVSGAWDIGHQPAAIRHGALTRREFQAKGAR